MRRQTALQITTHYGNSSATAVRCLAKCCKNQHFWL